MAAYECIIFLFFIYFRTLPSEITERNSTELCHMFGSAYTFVTCSLKINQSASKKMSKSYGLPPIEGRGRKTAYFHVVLRRHGSQTTKPQWLFSATLCKFSHFLYSHGGHRI